MSMVVLADIEKARARGDILQIYDMPGEEEVPVQAARVHLELETRGRDLSRKKKKAVMEAGYEVVEK